MLIHVKVEGRDGVVALEVPAEEDIDFLKEMVQIECGVDRVQQVLSFNGSEISIGTLLSNHLFDGCELSVRISAKRERKVCIADIPAGASPAEILQMVKEHPHLLDQFKNADPELGGVIETNDVTKLRTLIMKRSMNSHKRTYEQKQELARIENDPMNADNQRKIAEMIRLENINANMETAMESMPEAFGRVVMLYVDMKVNSYPLKCFVDSGAQMTIMTAQCVERCGLSHLIDTRFRGEARGVGSAKILGKIHIVQMELGNGEFYPVSITVLEGGDVEFLLGLDMLKRHRAVINLADNTLQFEGSTAVPFLSEKDLPAHARGHNTAESGSSSSSSGGATGSETSSSDNQTPNLEAKLPKPDPPGTESTSSASGTQHIVNATPPLHVQPTPPAPTTNAAGNLSNILDLTGPDVSQDTKVNYLRTLGFTEQESELALTQANGDIQLAASMLFLSRG